MSKGSPTLAACLRSEGEIARAVRQLANSNQGTTPSHLYLEMLRTAIRNNWMLDELDLSVITETLTQDGWTIQPKTGRLERGDAKGGLPDLPPTPATSTGDSAEEFLADPLFS